MYHLYEEVHVLFNTRPRQEQLKLPESDASYFSRVLDKTRLIFSRINGPNVTVFKHVYSGDKTKRRDGYREGKKILYLTENISALDNISFMINELSHKGMRIL